MRLISKALYKTTIKPYIPVLLEAASLFLCGRGKTIYILPYSYSVLALILMGFSEYDDDDELLMDKGYG
ncbi:hypothetical protein HanIR_Chr16g0824441 [Helianthus annuus]|nr:hypothetical protein HanIR_Chr16g0824441 [Helianthus annuus]